MNRAFDGLAPELIAVSTDGGRRIVLRSEELLVRHPIPEIRHSVMQRPGVLRDQLDAPAAMVDDRVAVAAERAGKIGELGFAPLRRYFHGHADAGRDLDDTGAIGAIAKGRGPDRRNPDRAFLYAR